MHTILFICFGAIIGLGMHHGLFIHGEWHVQAPHVLVSHILVYIYLVLVSKAGRQIYTSYLLALFISIITYRLCFHRLKNIPGPFWARVTKLWHLWKARTSQNHFFLAKLQTKYGDFVRTGPSEITVFHPDVFMAVDGPLSHCIKAEWYDLLYPNKALVTARTPDIHRDRRRQWNRGFTSKALLQYKEQMLSLIDQLVANIEGDIAAHEYSNVSEYICWLSFDRMGEFVLGKSFNMLNSQSWHHIVLLLRKAMSILGPLSPVPWLVQIAFKLMPRVWLLNDWFTMVFWCENELKQVQMPTKTSPGTHALAHYLKEDSAHDKTYEAWLTGDSILAIVAGSEPTAGVLVGLFCELAKHPVHADIIYKEIIRHQVDIRDGSDLARHCRHLEAAIFEALRLYPSLPTGGNRKTPSDEGITIAGVYIPPDTTVVGPKFVIGRRDDCFVRANNFIPERWTTRPEMVLNRAAFAPFGTGHRSCLGRALAMNDMMLVSANIIQRYQLQLIRGDMGYPVFDDWTDQFTSRLGRLKLRFVKRKN